MNTLRSKEIRLMLPAYAAALLLAVAPMWLLTNGAAEYFGSTDIFQIVAAYPLCFGLVLLALTCFGREFSLNTFQVLLAQPLERERIWRNKIAVLATAMVTIFAVWSVSWVMRVLFLHSAALDAGAGAYTVKVLDRFLFAFAGTMLLVAFSGGLWTTLLLRQLTAPFWFTLLLPVTVAMVVQLLGGNDVTIMVVLLLYSAVGFWLARKLFFNAQETAWTGGIFLLPGLRAKSTAQASNVRSRRPWLAMVRKEFQLQQVGLAGMAILFAVHLSTLLFHHGGPNDRFARAAGTVSDLCSMLWCVAPLFIGATSVAEERKMGMIEGHLCLPVSSRIQLAIKVAFVVISGGLMTALLLWTRMRVAHSMTGMADFVELKLADRPSSLTILSGLFTGIALLAFYASTLSRNLMQALVTGAVALLVVMGLIFAADPPFDSSLAAILPWQGPLVYFVGAITMVIVLLGLAYRNFRQLPEAKRLWRRNLIGWTAALLFTGTATAGLFNRTWEFLTPLEPAHGPARLTLANPPSLRAGDPMSSMVSALLPDGRIWENRFSTHGNWSFSLADNRYSLGIGRKWTELAAKPFVAGSNWVDVISWYRDTAAIRADGTLWVSGASRVRSPQGSDGSFRMDPPDTLIQQGNDSDWKKLISLGGGDGAALLLKKDGSLWRWESWSFDWKKPWTGMRTFQPYRLETASNFTDVACATGYHAWGGAAWLYAWSQSGEAWALTNAYNRTYNQVLPGEGLARLPILDHTKWRSITEWAPQWEPLAVGVRDDGTLWLWDMRRQGITRLPSEHVGKISQMGQETNWVSVAASATRTLVALKSDGTLWRWNRISDRRGSVNGVIWPDTIQPTRMGIHNDWVAICSALEGTLTLAADGSLWLWQGETDPWYYTDMIIIGSRKPTRLGNIFDKE